MLWTLVAFGTVVRKDCTPESGTRCSPCEYGTFMKHPNGLTKCFSCTSCDQGLIAVQECRATSDTVCDVLPGYFCKSLADDTGCSLAEKHKRCAPGQRIKQAGTSRTDAVCEHCQQGYFSQDGVNCTAWTTCSETQLKFKEGSATSDVVCASASRAHYSYIPVLLLSLTLVGLLFGGRLTLKNL
ncbi:tumor necrosis factor receptor superfamily member 14 isoform X2 [Siniperca chuatsi]|uniref:tumor necrosis factor receptor superfamily member 14 isoform X2 n=1 Tax=Siniperca chuatsi TaxID=119488 RepID=UPI001CE0B46C|nr:tumor necrosis factor receptor superfamily member 14 isoform X2 [Siniperca chuatsi]